MVLKERVMFREDQLVKTGDLYRRWACEPFASEPNTTIEELTELCDDGSLRAYAHVKGPIKGIVYCVPTNGIHFFEGQLLDEHVDYFLLEDVKRCEEKHPDFLGNPPFTDDPFADFIPPDPQEEIPVENIPDGKVSQILRVISATEVAKRWGVGAENLQEMTISSSKYDGANYLPVYRSPQKHIRPLDGQVLYFCSGPYFSFPGSGREGYDLEDHYFNADDVDAYEKNHPEEVWPIVEEEQAEEETEFLTADDVRKELGMSPSQFVDVLNGKRGPRLITSDEDGYKTYWDENNFCRGKRGDYFTTDRLESLPMLLIHRVDLQEYMAERQATTEPASDTSTLTARLVESQAERDRLSEALKKAQARIAEMEAIQDEPVIGPQTNKATQARQEKILEAWQNATRSMIDVAIQCGKDGERQRQKSELEGMFKALGATLSKSQFDFFRDCLPDGHKNTTGGDWRKK